MDLKVVSKIEKFLEIKLLRSISITSPFKLSYSLNQDNQIKRLTLSGCIIFNLNYLITEILELKELKVLDLSINGIIDLEPLSKMINLSSLNLDYDNEIIMANYSKSKSRTIITSFFNISPLAKIKSLASLGIENMVVQDFSVLKNLKNLKSLSVKNSYSNFNTIEYLTCLTNLNIPNNNINNIDFCSKLKSLEFLDISKNNISDYSPINELIKLKKLKTSNLNIRNFPTFSQLSNLKHLSIRNSELEEDVDNVAIESLLNEIGELSKLEVLELAENRLNNINFLSGLNNLIELNLSFNKIVEINSLENLFKLTTLDLSNNSITDLSPLKYLKKLKFLNLSFNTISVLPPWIFNLNVEVYLNKYYFRGILLRHNPISSPPIAIISLGKTALKRYFKKINEEGIDFIFEAKVIMVGDGNAGKTSLKRRLINENASLPRKDIRTRGIELVDWVFKIKNKVKYIAHIWDFGGQNMYYPVHRFFITEDSVFVLLASTRDANHNFDYWIPTIYQFGGLSPIIIGQTCYEGATIQWNDLGVYISNPNFKIIKTREYPYYNLNLPNNNEGLKIIKNVIINEIEGLPHYGRGVPKSWIPVRAELKKESKESAFISFERFKEICVNSNSISFENNSHIKDCCEFFHNIGAIIWYSKIEALKNWVILQPDWAMNAVYEIIDDKKIQKQFGIILNEDFQRIWKHPNYDEMQPILKKMLSIFKIAFSKTHKQEDYIIPARLLSIPLEQKWIDSELSLKLEYNYEFMPKGIVNQLSAELSRYIIADNEVWNNAVNIGYDDSDTKCQVFEDYYNRKITIKAKGRDARGLIILVRNVLSNIHDEYKGVKPSINVPCGCLECTKSSYPTFYSYDRLMEWYKKDENTPVFCNEGRISVLVKDLLFYLGFETKINNLQTNDNSSNRNPLKAFISYSKYDAESNKDDIDFLEEFKKTLVPLSSYNKVIETWDDTNLIPGEDWNKQIIKNLETSDLIFLLISSNFLSTRYIKEDELRIAINRHDNGECVVIPIIISACGWQEISFLSNLNGIPRKGNTILSWSNEKKWKARADAWHHVFNEIKKLILDFQISKS